MGQSASRAQARWWLLTLFDDSWKVWSDLPQGVNCLRGQQETCPTTGAKHWQLFISFKRAVRLAAIKKLFGSRIHAEPSRSKSAEEYVFKDETSVEGTRFELGSKPLKRNSKTDWALVKECAKCGNLEEIPDDIYIKYYNVLKRIAMDNMIKPVDLTSCAGIWIYGPPGVGKSHYVRQHYGESLYLKAQNKWWDGYQGERNVLLDDFDCKVLGHYIKIWADKYTFIGECKGSSIQIRPQNFIITSNYTPEQIWDDEMLIQAIKRRFYFIYLPMRMF